MIAKKRNIAHGRQFDRFFPKPEGVEKVVFDFAQINNTLDTMKKVAEKYQSDTEQIASILQKSTRKATLASIWDFIYGHIQYKLDRQGVERIERPAATWAVRQEGVDCDGYSVFISSILLNLNIPHHFKDTKYNGESSWQHVYIVAPKEGQEIDYNSPSSYYTLDCVKDLFDDEHPNITDVKITPMAITQLSGLSLTVLSGTSNASLAFQKAKPIIEALLANSVENELAGIGMTISPHQRVIHEVYVNPVNGDVYGIDAAQNAWLLDFTTPNLQGVGFLKKIVSGVANIGKKVGNTIVGAGKTVVTGVVEVGKNLVSTVAINNAMQTNQLVTTSKQPASQLQPTKVSVSSSTSTPNFDTSNRVKRSKKPESPKKFNIADYKPHIAVGGGIVALIRSRKLRKK